MKFTPKSKEEAMQIGLLPKGNYPFVVKQAYNKTSKSSGKPMIEIILGVWDSNGREHQIYDYLMESVEHKLRHFCYAINCGEMSEIGEFDIFKVMNKNGICKIIIKEDKTGEYLPKNVVVDYIVDEKNSAVMSESAINAIQDTKSLNDELPF